MHPLVIATHNAHKTEEISALLQQQAKRWQIQNLTDHPGFPPVAETGNSFEENAALKAVATSHRLKGHLVLADDSGIEVDALSGRPGIFSARFAGEGADDAANRAKLLRELADNPEPHRRSARFYCAMVLARDGLVLSSVSGTVEGTVSGSERGGGGFGYDPIFIPEGHAHTFAELPPEVKNSISHRARALIQIAYYLRALRT